MATTTIDNTSTPPFAELKRDYTQRKEQRDKLDAEMHEIKGNLNKEFAKYIITEGLKVDIDVRELFGGKRKGKHSANGTGTKAKPLYRDPANPNLTWSGRGKPAKWLETYIKQGRKKDEFRIPGTEDSPKKPKKKVSEPAAKIEPAKAEPKQRGIFGAKA